MKILAIIEAYQVTGPARNLLSFAQRASAGTAGFPPFEINLATYRRPGDPAETPFLAEAARRGLRVDVIEERGRFDWQSAAALRRLVEANSPAIVQTHNYKSHLLARAVSSATRTPWIAFHHGYTATDFKDVLLSQADRISLPGAARIVTVCEAFRRQLTDRHIAAERIEVVHNPVAIPPPISPDERARAREALNVDPGAQVVVTLGRMSREKAHADLVEAAARVPGLVTLIAGEGPERSALEEQIRERGIAGRVRLLGHLQNTRHCYAAADVLALPSHSEGSPNVLLEAFAAGVPVVATAVGGVPEIACDSENALLVPAANPARLAAAIERLLADFGLAQALAATARETALDRHSFAAFDKRLIGIYESVVPGRLMSSL